MRITAIKTYQTNISSKPQAKAKERNSVNFGAITHYELLKKRTHTFSAIKKIIKQYNEGNFDFNTAFQRCVQTLDIYLNNFRNRMPILSTTINEAGDTITHFKNGEQIIENGNNIFLMPKIAEGVELTDVKPLALILNTKGVSQFLLSAPEEKTAVNGRLSAAQKNSVIKLIKQPTFKKEEVYTATPYASPY